MRTPPGNEKAARGLGGSAAGGRGCDLRGPGSGGRGSRVEWVCEPVGALHETRRADHANAAPTMIRLIRSHGDP
jgi:hypothetical protein